MTRAPRPTWLISYENKDISVNVAEKVTSVSYTDHLKGKSDELELTLEDSTGIWRSGWYPGIGDRFDVKIGYENQPLVACGRFEVDSVDLDGPPDVITVRGLATGNSSPLRSAKSKAFEGLDIEGIVKKVAGEYGYEVVGNFPAGMATLKRVSQANESDLAFLRRVAEEYGFVFSMRGERLVFFSLLELEQAPTVTTIQRADLNGYSFKNKAQGTYVACEVSFTDPASGKVVMVRVEEENVRPRGEHGNAAGPVPSTTIRNGSRGDQVRDWQRFLAGQSMYTASVDGIFGAITDRGTRSFQRAQSLKVDGIVGPDTYGAASRMGFAASSGDVGKGGAADVLRKQIRCESVAEAETKAKALLRAANRLKATGTLELDGNQLLVAGSKVELADMARLSGKYMVNKSTHRMARSGGYATSLEVSYV